MGNRIIKIVAITFGAIIIISVVAFALFFFILPNNNTDNQVAVIREESEIAEEETIENRQAFLETEDFADTFLCFYYPGSEIKELQLLDPNEESFYMLLNIGNSFGEVEEFYKQKKIQYIWKRSEIYESGSYNIEQGFLQDSDSNPTSKFTYYSSDKEKIVNVLINGISDGQTEVMAIYWKLN